MHGLQGILCRVPLAITTFFRGLAALGEAHPRGVHGGGVFDLVLLEAFRLVQRQRDVDLILDAFVIRAGAPSGSATHQ